MRNFRERLLAKQASKQSGTASDQTSSSRGSAMRVLKKPATPVENIVYPPPIPGENILYGLPTTGARSLYRPLDFDTFEIRLLRLSRGDKASKIHCSLEYASLINPPEYTALSYRWGDTRSLTGCINIGDWGDIKITDSLERALRDVRQVNREGSSFAMWGKLFWVDAVCINQQDWVERSQQVRQMRQIYSRAKEVISWVDCRQGEAVEYLIEKHSLGQAQETTDPVPMLSSGKEKLRIFERKFEIRYGRFILENWNSAQFGEARRGRDELEKTELEKRKCWVEKEWKIMEEFFGDEYWRRVWVIQEVAVATEIKLFCGERIIPWENVFAVWERWKNEPESVPVEARSYLKAIHLAEFRYRFQIKREPISLLDAMRWTYQAEATDPRDKIFALLGLCHDGPNYVPVPNYKQPLEEIIADMSKAMMSFDRSLDLMCLKGTSPAEEGKLPSWTPNWVNLWSGSTHSMTFHEAAYTDWHTTFSFNPILYGSTTQILKVEGIFYGLITDLTSELAKPDPDGILTLKIKPRAAWISSTSSLADTEIPTALHSDADTLKYRDSIWKTLTMGLLLQQMNDNDAALCFARLWTPEGRGAVHNIALINWLDHNAWFEWGRYERRVGLRWWSRVGHQPTLQPTIPGSPGADSKHHTDLKSFCAHLKQLAAQSAESQRQKEDKASRMFDTFIETLEKVLGSGMRLAVATAGELSQESSPSKTSEQIVLAPPATKESDHVWFIKGCSVPLILREVVEVKRDAVDPIYYEVRTGKYKVIGGLYVSDFVKQEFEDEEKWTRGEVVKGLEGTSTVLNLC